MKRPPNIILCLCDQMRAFEVGCYGHPTIRTPHIDRLAQQGGWFPLACSNSPLCVPARSVLLSGQYARTCTGTSSNFCGFPPSRQRLVCRDATLPEILRTNGYQTGLVGKWHLHPAPDLVGFDDVVYVHNLHQHHGQAFYDREGRRTVVPGFSLDYEMEQVRRFVSTNRDAPFFLQYNLSPPHMPLLDAPEKYATMYGRDDVILRENVYRDGKPPDDRDWFAIYLWDYLGHLRLHLKEEETFMPDDYRQRKSQAPTHGIKRLLTELRELMKHPQAGPVLRERLPYLDDARVENMDLVDLAAWYYGMVTCVDDKVGELLAFLESERLTEDTLVIFASDHGDNLGSHHCWMKDHLYEESYRIPLLCQWPGTLPSQQIESQVASLLDVMPTVLALVGIDPPGHCQGVDLSPVLRGESAAVGPNTAFIETYRHRHIGVRSLTHLYGIPMEGDRESDWQPAAELTRHVFHDLRTDPFQQTTAPPADLAEPIATELRERLVRWHRDTPRMPMPEPTSQAKSVAIY